MTEKIYQTLFVCTGNSARSILAESLMNHMGQGRFQAFSAGSQPAGRVNPLTLKALAQLGLSTEGLRSKSWLEFSAPGAPEPDFVITVCDNAANEVCPVWPGNPVTAHWGLPDPALVEADDERKLKAFVDTALQLKRRIELLLSLPMASLDRMSLQNATREIGSQ